MAEHDLFESQALPHLGAVARFALSLTRERTDADDLVQDTYLNARRSWHTFAAGADCRKWLFAICRNRFLSIHRASAWMINSDEGDLDAMPAVLGHAMALATGAADAFDRHDLMPAIESALAMLREPHRSVLVLIDVEGESYEDAAEILGIPVGTVRSRLFRARRLVQEELLRFAEDAGFGGASTDKEEG